MKKVIGLILLVSIFLSACSNKDNHNILDQIGKEYEKSHGYPFNSLTVYTNGENYLAAIEEAGTIHKYAVFSSERECTESTGLDLIENCDVNDFLSVAFDEVEERLGSHHVAIGSGFYIPSYITEDAYLISLYPQDGYVYSVIKRDLLTDEIVDEVSTDA